MLAERPRARDNTSPRQQATAQATVGSSILAKYRQHGYQDRDERDKTPKSSGGGQGGGQGGGAPKRDLTFGPRPVNMPGRNDVSRCSQCGTVLREQDLGSGKCPKCGFELHSCKQCMFFDPSSRNECMKPVKQRIMPKDTSNDCEFYQIRVTTEKQTSTPVAAKPNDARQAFENLFKK